MFIIIMSFILSEWWLWPDNKKSLFHDLWTKTYEILWFLNRSLWNFMIFGQHIMKFHEFWSKNHQFSLLSVQNIWNFMVSWSNKSWNFMIFGPTIMKCHNLWLNFHEISWFSVQKVWNVMIVVQKSWNNDFLFDSPMRFLMITVQRNRLQANRGSQAKSGRGHFCIPIISSRGRGPIREPRRRRPWRQHSSSSCTSKRRKCTRYAPYRHTLYILDSLG